MRTLAARLGGLALVASLSVTGGCQFHRHEHLVGTGPNGLGTETATQYYFFFGWFQLNEVDTERMTDGLSSYRITTGITLFDLVISPLLLPFTVTTRTVTVDR